MQFVLLTESLRRAFGEQRRARRRAEAERDENAALLVERDARIAALETELAQACSNSAARQEGDEERTERQVGLHPRAPDWLILAAR
ncbi:hypothetical protein ACRAWG_36255 [Methylobacterium sp. P31]